jgi:hypothetical protein
MNKDEDNLRRYMALIVSADRLKKIKRLFDTKKVEDIYVYEYSEFFKTFNLLWYLMFIKYM